jgi:DNA-directed RNA polymerase specialized sigma24 family protein
VSLSGYFTGEDDDGFPEDELAETLFGVPHTPEGVPQNAAVGRAGQALSELPPPQREVFEKTELHGYSIKMLAEETGASEQALLSRKHKAVLFLRTRLRDVYDALTGE